MKESYPKDLKPLGDIRLFSVSMAPKKAKHNKLNNFTMIFKSQLIKKRK
jgi:hypothetical protein